jgi:long-chain acyl-CoA synthetase
MSDDLWSFINQSLLAHGRHKAWNCRLLGRKHRKLTYHEFRRRILTLASRLRERGIGSGDVVAIMGNNGPEWAAAAFAVWKAGGIVAPVHTSYTDEEMAALLKAVRPKLVMVHGIDRRLPNTMVISLDDEAERVEAEEGIPVELDPDQEAVRSYTSGSTGTPKMVRLSHRNIVANVRAASRCATVGTRDRFLSLLPLSHMLEMTGGLLLPLANGATIVVPRVLASSEILDALRTEKITGIIAVPRLYRNIMMGLEKKLRGMGWLMKVYRALLRRMPVGLRRVLNWPIRRQLGGRIVAWISGGSRLDPQITRYFRDLGLPLRQGYGLTETSPVISIQDSFEPVLDCVGRPLEGLEVRIHAPDEQGSGELWVRGPNVMLGYADKRQTREVMDGRWFRTGDLARIDERGNIILTGRCKRLIVTEAGKNVYPEELETLLERIPGVKEAAVLEVDMRPAAVLALDGEHQVEHARRILREFNARVSKHSQITRFALVDELPRTPIGKVALQMLPEIFAAKEIT